MLRHNATELIGLPPVPKIGSNNVSQINNSFNSITTPKMSSHINSINNNPGSPLDALPKQFVLSMKTLFDILDDQQTGFVKFSDIEKGWQDDGYKGMPSGVIDSLRKVTPLSGLLSFERFCAGLKLCLLKNQNDAANKTEGRPRVTTGAIRGSTGTTATASFTIAKAKLSSQTKQSRSPSAPLLDIENPLPNVQWSTNPTATVRPHNVSNTQRALSMPQLSPDSELGAQLSGSGAVPSFHMYNSPPPPPKPPRASALQAAAVASNPPENGGAGGILTTAVPIPKAEIRHALQNWQMGVLLSEMSAKDKRKPSSSYLQNQFHYRGSADGGSSSATDSPNGTVAMPVTKKSSSKRREPRRHTLQNGIDYNMLKRLRQIEEEREVLMLGLDAVEKAREWYIQQIANVQEKIKYLGHLGGQHVEQWSEVQQERLNFQRARVLEVNRNLAGLADAWERGGFPVHFNLAIRTPGKSTTQRSNSNGLLQPVSVDRLRQQNRNLTNELSLKSDRIALLEREKQAILRELYELQQRMGISARGTGFISVLSQSSPVCSSSSGGLGDADVVF